jgi:hypothetical protein
MKTLRYITMAFAMGLCLTAMPARADSPKVSMSVSLTNSGCRSCRPKHRHIVSTEEVYRWKKVGKDKWAYQSRVIGTTWCGEKIKSRWTTLYIERKAPYCKKGRRCRRVHYCSAERPVQRVYVHNVNHSSR